MVEVLFSGGKCLVCVDELVDSLEGAPGLVGSAAFREPSVHEGKDVGVILEIPDDILGAMIHVKSPLAEDEHRKEVGCSWPPRAVVGGGDAIDRLSVAAVVVGLVRSVNDGGHQPAVGFLCIVVDEHEPFAI